MSPSENEIKTINIRIIVVNVIQQHISKVLGMDGKGKIVREAVVIKRRVNVFIQNPSFTIARSCLERSLYFFFSFCYKK